MADTASTSTNSELTTGQASGQGAQHGSPADFFKLLYGDVGAGYVEIAYLSPDSAPVDRISRQDPDGRFHRVSTVVDWRGLPLGEVDPRMKRLHQMNRRGYGVHYGVTVRGAPKQGEWRTSKKTGKPYWCFFPRGTIADALYITALWADADAHDYGGDLDEARRRIDALPAGITIFTGGGYQKLMLLDQPLEITNENRSDIKRTLQGIAKAVGSDKSVAELSRLLRLPGFVNTKPERGGARCEVVAVEDMRHSFSDLFATYAPLIVVAPPSSHPKYTAADDQQIEVINALRHIPAETIDYVDWITVLAGLHSSFDETTALSIAEQWSGHCSKRGEIAGKMATLNNGYSGTPATLGSIFHMAKQFGYSRPAPTLRVVRRDQDRPTTGHAAARPPTSPYFHADGMPDNWLRAFCKVFHGHKNAPKFARLWFEGLRSGLLDPLDVTFDALIHARDRLHIPLKDSAIRAFPTYTEELFGYLNKSFSSCSNSKIIRRGPPEKHFAARTLAEIEATLDRRAACRFDEARHLERGTTPNIDQHKAAALDGDARRAALEIMGEQPRPSDQTRISSWLARKHTGELARSLKDLTPTTIPLDTDDIRAALRAQDHTDDEQRSYGNIARDYGMSKGSVSKLNAGAHLAPVEVVVNCPISGSADVFEQEVRAVCKREGGHPRALVEITDTGKRIEHEFQTGDPEGNRDVYTAAQSRGSRIEVTVRQANKYRRLDPSEQAAPAVQPATTATRRRPPAAPRPAIRPYYGDGYNPAIVRMWLITHLRRLKWHEASGWFTNPATGEKFDLREKTFLEAAESLGAVVTEVA